MAKIVAAGRQRSLIIPREHGAWGILLVPLLTGASVGLQAGGGGGSLVPFGIVALALFWLRTPVESWVGAAPIRARTPGEIRLVRIAALSLAAVAVGASILLFWGERNRALISIGCATGALFLIQAILKRAFEGRLVPQDPDDEPAEIRVQLVCRNGQQNNRRRDAVEGK